MTQPTDPSLLCSVCSQTKNQHLAVPASASAVLSHLPVFIHDLLHVDQCLFSQLAQPACLSVLPALH